MSKERSFGRQSGPTRFDPILLGDDPSYFDTLERDAKKVDSIDWIVVPQGRSAESIDHAAYLGRDIGARVISLCSHDADIEKVAERFEKLRVPEWAAIDIPPGYTIPGIELIADQAIPTQAQKDPSWNLSDKRNVAIIMALLSDAERIFFHDDDLYILAEALGKVGTMLFQREIAGLRCGSFPDRSAIMHARRIIADYHMSRRPLPIQRDALTSGNSMGVDIRRMRRHFPRGIYNEDWIAQYDAVVRKKAAVVDDYYHQTVYNPLTPKRAQQEEFGDILITGLFQGIDLARKDPSAQPHLKDRFYWEKIIEVRREQALSLLDATEIYPDKRYHRFTSNPKNWQPMPYAAQEELRGSLLAGLDVNVTLEGVNFVDYLSALNTHDNVQWADMLNKISHYPIPFSDVCARVGLERYLTNISPGTI